MLIGAAAWLVRRFGVTRIEATTRGRQPRLAVVDFASVDGRRKLIIIRRDNVEHLVMIGGPSDVVVETNIVRGAAVTNRDQPATANRAVPIPDPPRGRCSRSPMAPRCRRCRTCRRTERAPARAPPTRRGRRRSSPPFRRCPAGAGSRDSPGAPGRDLAGLAEDLARPTEPIAVRPVQVQPQAPRRGPLHPFHRHHVPTDQSLAEMAQRLEAALRRPTAQKVVTETQRVTATVEIKAVPAAAQSGAGAAARRRRPTQARKNDLEQEMASLLSKPGKT